MKIEELLGRTIRDIKMRHEPTHRGFDGIESYIVLDNNMIIDVPYSDEEEVLIKRDHKNAKSIKSVMNGNAALLLDKKIIDIISFDEDTMDGKGFIELENHYLITEVTMAPQGTGRVGLWYYSSIKTVEQEFGDKFKRLTNRSKEASGEI